MRYLIIRSCDRDEQLACYCLLSALKQNVADAFIFFHEGENAENIKFIIKEYKEQFTTDDISIIHRGIADNLGGYSNVLQYLKDCKELLPQFKDEDTLIFADSDIFFLKNPLEIIEKEVVHAGFCAEKPHIGGEIYHISGQLNIVKGWFWNKYASNFEENCAKCRKILDKYQYSIADDTILSVFSHVEDVEQMHFWAWDYWLHQKLTEKEFKKLIANDNKN